MITIKITYKNQNSKNRDFKVLRFIELTYKKIKMKISIILQEENLVN